MTKTSRAGEVAAVGTAFTPRRAPGGPSVFRLLNPLGAGRYSPGMMPVKASRTSSLEGEGALRGLCCVASLARLFAPRAAGFIVVMLAFLAAWPLLAQPFRLLALSGTPAPGTEAGTEFFRFNTFPLVVDPPVDSAGTGVLFGRISGPLVQSDTDTGVWVESGQGLTLVARAGDSAPGAGPGVVFLDFSIIELAVRPTIAHGRVVFQGLLIGPTVGVNNLAGLWTSAGGSVALLLRTGDPAPGLAGELFASFFHHGLSPSGAALIAARTTGNAGGDEALWSERGGTLSIALREGDPIAGLPNGVVLGHLPQSTAPLFFLTSLAQDDSVAVTSTLRGPGVTATDDEVVIAEIGGIATLIAREGDPLPGHPGETFGKQGLSSPKFGRLDSGGPGRVAFVSSLGGASFRQGIFSNRSGVLETHALTNEPAPGTTSTFFSINRLQLNRANDLLFQASTLDAVGVGNLWSVTDGDVTPFALRGELLPGLSGNVLLGAGALHGWTDDGLAVFDASIEDPVLATRSVILGGNPTIGFQILVELFVPLDLFGDGSDFRIVSRIESEYLSPSGDFHYVLDFMDGSSGVFIRSLTGRIFTDGFESGDTLAWSLMTP